MLRYQGSVYRLAWRILGRREEAEDVVQDTFLKAYGKLASCRDRSRFWPWIRRIAVNTCMDRISLESPCEDVEELREAESSMEDPVESEAIRRAEASDIQRVVDGLPMVYRAVIILRYEEELAYKEIADLLGDSVSNVQVRLHRAKRMLVQRLAVIINEMC